MKELKPCPFCGGDVELSTYNNGEGYVIECKNHEWPRQLSHASDIAGDIDMVSWGLGDDARKALIEAWNTRSENTCTYNERDYKDCRTYQCSNCEYEIEGHHFERNMPNYCQNCGLKILKVIRNA